MGGGYMNDFYACEFWRFVYVQQAVAKLASDGIEYPPMPEAGQLQPSEVIKEIKRTLEAHGGQ